MNLRDMSDEEFRKARHDVAAEQSRRARKGRAEAEAKRVKERLERETQNTDVSIEINVTDEAVGYALMMEGVPEAAIVASGNPLKGVTALLRYHHGSDKARLLGFFVNDYDHAPNVRPRDEFFRAPSR